MSVLSKEEFMAQLQSRVGDDTSDEAIAFMENMTDTYNDMEQKTIGDGTDWKSKYEENDKMWREKYTKRFYDGDGNGSPDEEGDGSPREPEAPKTYNDLFKIGE